jgi:hypothetical protein
VNALAGGSGGVRSARGIARKHSGGAAQDIAEIAVSPSRGPRRVEGGARSGRCRRLSLLPVTQSSPRVPCLVIGSLEVAGPPPRVGSNAKTRAPDIGRIRVPLRKTMLSSIARPYDVPALFD